jgi:vacuolar-type H+-ATPase subunit I/STV1
MIEKYKTYVPVAEKIALAKKISENSNVIDEKGIINKNNLKIASTSFFIGAYVQDKEYTTNDYDYIKENKLESNLRSKLEKDEINEWETILENEINLVAMQRKFESTNIAAALVSLLRSAEKSIDSKNFDKMAKQINKIIDDPEKLKNFKSLQEVAAQIQ